MACLRSELSSARGWLGQNEARLMTMLGYIDATINHSISLLSLNLGRVPVTLTSHSTLLSSSGIQQAVSTTCSFESSHMGEASLLPSGQHCFPRRMIEVPCLYENIYPSWPEIPVWLSRIRPIGLELTETNSIVQGGACSEKGYLLPLTSLLLVFLFVPAAISAPYMDRHEIAARAHSAVNGNYYWGGESW